MPVQNDVVKLELEDAGIEPDGKLGPFLFTRQQDGSYEVTKEGVTTVDHLADQYELRAYARRILFLGYH